MFVDAALRSTFRNFSTLFFLVAVITVPLHIAHSYLVRDVIALDDLHPEIEELPEARQVRGVGVDDLRRARVSYVVLSILELALAPLLVRAARSVVTGEHVVTTVLSAYRGLPDARRAVPGRQRLMVWVLVAAAFAAIVAVLFRAGGLVLIEPLGDEHAFPWVGLVEGTARAVGGAFLVGPLAYLTAGRRT